MSEIQARVVVPRGPRGQYKPNCPKCGELKTKKLGKNWVCVPCRAQYMREHYQRRTDRDKILDRSRIWVSSNKDRIRDAKLRKMYGIGLPEYGEMLASQNGVCAICLKPETTIDRWGNVRNLCVDHNHVSGVVRGLLCVSCNMAIGKLGDSQETMRRAASYLEAR